MSRFALQRGRCPNLPPTARTPARVRNPADTQLLNIRAAGHPQNWSATSPTSPAPDKTKTNDDFVMHLFLSML